ncbi:MAG: DUF1761 domain-containing protein [Candidatus Limnocylindria bacterium]
MTFDTLGQLNWLAVLVGAAMYFGLGALWYSRPLFARPWMRSIGWDESRQQPQASPITYIAPALLYVVAAIATAWLAAATGSDTIGEGVLLGLVVGIGYALVINAVDASFDPNKPQPWLWFAITGSYHLIGLIIVAVLVSIWR